MDPRKGNPFYYDLDESPLDDVPFYLREIGSNSAVLELGCGTGRTLIALAKHCREITGVDYSADMVESCGAKIPKILKGKCTLQVGDITKLQLNQEFDHIIAPYRVMQALETDQEVNGLFSTIRNHLKPNGTCILNAFSPNKPKEDLIRAWSEPFEQKMWEKRLPDGSSVVHIDRKESITKDPLVLIVKLIYHKYFGTDLVGEFIQPIKMRCYYPDEFKQLIISHGFQILDSWGGYRNEKYGEGPELVVNFSK